MLEITENLFVHCFDSVTLYHLGVIVSQFSFLGTKTTHTRVLNLAYCFMLHRCVEGFGSVPVVVAVIPVPQRFSHHLISVQFFRHTNHTHTGVLNLAHRFMLDGWVEGFGSVPMVIAVIRVSHRIPHHLFTAPPSTDLGDEGCGGQAGMGQIGHQCASFLFAFFLVLNRKCASN